MNITVIIDALNEEPFIGTCIRAVYPFVKRIMVVTNYDRSHAGHRLKPDGTVSGILSIDDPENKIYLIVNRGIMDEALQRNWAIQFDRNLSKSARRRFLPYCHPKKEIERYYAETDYFWIIDADEIYDPSTVPAMIRFVAGTNGKNVLVRGFNHFKKWNYRIDPSNDHFWQLGFIKSPALLYSSRNLYHPRPLGWLGHISPDLAEKARNAWINQIKMPETIGFFYHGSYIGDDDRIAKKFAITVHAKEQAPYVAKWIESTWKKWTPDMRNFYFGPKPEIFSKANYFPTSDLPEILKDSKWPEGWIER